MGGRNMSGWKEESPTSATAGRERFYERQPSAAERLTTVPFPYLRWKISNGAKTLPTAPIDGVVAAH
jgi:hypothetical protein